MTSEDRSIPGILKMISFVFVAFDVLYFEDRSLLQPVPKSIAIHRVFSLCSRMILMVMVIGTDKNIPTVLKQIPRREGQKYNSVERL